MEQYLSPEVEAPVLQALGALSRAFCVASLSTMEKGIEATCCFAAWWPEVLKERLHLDWVCDQIKFKQSEVERLDKNIAVELKAQPLAKEFVHAMMERRSPILREIDSLSQRRVAAHLHLRNKAAQADRDYAKTLRAFQMAIRDELDRASRKELGMKIDKLRYQELIESAAMKNIQVSDGFIAWIEDFHVQLSGGKDPFADRTSPPEKSGTSQPPEGKT